MNAGDELNLFRTAGRRSLIVGLACVGVMLVGLCFSRQQFFRAYLAAYTTILGITIGSMLLVMLHHLVGGAWGVLIRRIAEAAGCTIPLLAVLFVPIAIGFRWLYPWARIDEVMADPILLHRQHMFNVGAIVLRAVIYFAIWTFWAWRLRSNSLKQDRSDDPALSARARKLSGSGLVVFFIIVSLAAVDWIASREPHWYSSVFGLLVVVGQGTAAISFALAMLALLSPRTSLGDITLPDSLHDLGNLLLTIVILWAYISFSQFLVIWIGNSTEDNIFFVHRSVGIWRVVGACLILLHFALPFLLLLNQGAKRNLRALGAIAAGVLVLRFVNSLWLVAPSSSDAIPGSLNWLDLFAPFAIGGFWLFFFFKVLSCSPLVPCVRESLPAPLTGARI